MLTILFPGSFDPPTSGHLNLIERCAGIYDQVHVVVAVNPNKRYFLSADVRVTLMREMCESFANVSVHVWDHLIVEFADKVGARMMVRGVRALDDFNYEFELSMLNKGLNPRVETVFMPTDPKYFVLRSSAIKDLARFGGDISSMVPENVARAVFRKVKEEDDAHSDI